MENQSTKGIRGEKEKRARVNRIKMSILCSLLIWMALSFFLCIFLFVKVISLEHKLDYLMDHFVIREEVETETETAQSTEVAAYQQLDTELLSYEEEQYPIAQAANFKENLANPGDPLKVYLTFDDGPSSNTVRILDILNQYQVKATFFVIGRQDEASKTLYQRIVEEGHTLGMHSYSHKYGSIYASLEAFQEDFSKIQNYLFEVTGQECLYYRFPGGSSNQVSNQDMSGYISYLNSQGITYYDWNVSSGDATSQAFSPQELVENVVSDVVKYKTSVVLMHDTDKKNATVEALGTMIEEIQALGAEIMPIQEDTTVIQHIAADSVE